MIGEEGRELQRRLLQAAFDIDSAREQRAAQVTSAAGIPHGSVEEGHGRGVTSVFGPVRVTRLAYRNRREPNLYPADARQVLPDDPYSLGMGPWRPSTWPRAGSGRPRRSSRPGPASRSAAPSHRPRGGSRRLDGRLLRAARRDADTDLPATDVIMMQGDGKGIAMRRSTARTAGRAIRPARDQEDGRDRRRRRLHPRRPRAGDIAAPPARRQAHPGPKARDKWVSASVTESIEDMIAAAYDEADRRDPQRARQRVFLVDGNKQQITAIEAQAEERGLKVPVLIDYITSAAISARPPPPCTPATPPPRASGPTGSCCASCTAAQRPSRPPSPLSPARPARTPASAASTSPTWTGQSPT